MHHRQTFGRLLLLVFVVGMTARCTGGGGSSGPPSQDPDVESTPPPTLEFASPRASPSPSDAVAIETYVGRLGSDAVEAGCTYLEAPDGRRFEVVYPEGWTVRRAPLALLDPTGQAVAGAGDVVTVRGTVAGDMVSICQLGPIVRAVEVVPG